MAKRPKHDLRIADTPTDEELADIEAAGECSALPPVPDSQAKSSRSGRTERLSSEEMDAEIARVNRLNGMPTLARDTCQDE